MRNVSFVCHTESTRDEPLFAESQFFTFLSDVGSGDSRLIDGNFVNSKTVKELKNIGKGFRGSPKSMR